MADENQVLEQEQTATEVVASTDPFSEGAWSETLPNAAENTTQQNAATAENTTTETTTHETVEDGRNFLKEKLGFDDWDLAKTELEKLKNTPATVAEVKYENEVSEKIHKALQEGKTEEVYYFLEQQAKLNNLTTGDVTVANAADIVKAAMKAKYADFDKEDIEYRFNKQFGTPKEPVQGISELDEEFEARKFDWERNVKDAERELLMEAKVLRPELEKLKAELKLPEIAKNESTAQAPTQEDLDSAKKYKDTFLQTIEPSLQSFTGFNVTYKDEDVEITSTYAPSDDEKGIVSSKLKLLAEQNFNSNALFSERWVNDDNTLNTAQIAKDILLLESEGKIAQKFVTDTVSKRLMEYRKATSKINVEGSNGTFQPEGDKNDPAKMGEFFFSQ